MSSQTLGFAVIAVLVLVALYATIVLRRGGAALASGLSDARDRALEALGAGLVVVDRRGRVASYNDEAKLLLGFDDGVVPPFRVLSALRDIPALGNLLVAGEGATEVDLGEGAGRRKVEAKIFRFGRSRKAAVLVLRDVTESAALLEELSALASQDPLTGAFNRRRFDELGERDIELSRRSGSAIGVLMLDLDLFKRVNDERGHAVGDELLKAICAACKDALRSSDVFARYGGEEFAVLLPGSGVEESMAVAERLRARIEELRVPYEGGSVSITASVGVFAGVPLPGDTLALYLRRSDEALYRSKARGRNKVSYWEPLK